MRILPTTLVLLVSGLLWCPPARAGILVEDVRGTAPAHAAPAHGPVAPPAVDARVGGGDAR